MAQLNRETSTSTAHVNKILRDLGCELVAGGNNRNRFKDGWRVKLGTERYAPIPVTLTSRRRTYDVRAEVDKVVAALPDMGLEAHDIHVSEDNKHGSFNIVRTFVKGKSKDGKTVTKLEGRYWSIQINMGNMWIVEVKTDTTDLRTVDVDNDSIRKWPFTVAATLKKTSTGEHGRTLMWVITMGDKKLEPSTSLRTARQTVLDALKES